MGTTTGLKPDSMVYDPDNDSFYRSGDRFGSGIDYLRAATGIDYPDYVAEAINDAQAQDYINSLLETDPSLESPTEYLALNQAQSQAPLNQMVASMRSVGSDNSSIGNLVIAKDNEFQSKVEDLGGVSKDTLGAVIDAANQTYGEGDSRAVATVVSEAFKAGLQMKDLAEAAGIEESDVVNATRTAAQDPNKALSLPEMGRNAANTVFETANKVADLVETGLEKTGIEKVVNTVGNTVAKIVGLDPNKSQKAVVINPTTGQVTVQASNIPGGGVLGKLPQSPYVPVGTTSGGTVYGVDLENALLNVVLGKIRTQGGLDASDIEGVAAAGIEEITGIPMETAGALIKGGKEIAKEIKDVVTGSLVEGSTATNNMGPFQEEDSSTQVIVGGSGNRQDDEDALANQTGFETINGADTINITGGSLIDDDDLSYTKINGTGDDTLTLNVADEDDGCPEGQIKDKNGNCYTPGVTSRTTTDEDLTTDFDPCPAGSGKSRNAEGICVCPGGTIDVGGICRPLDEDDDDDDDTTVGGGGTDKIICPDTYNNAGAEVDNLNQCGGLKSTGGQTKICPEGTQKAFQEVDINTDCGIITGGQTKICPEGTQKAFQEVDINTDCGIITGGQTKICPEGTQKAGQEVDINTDCGIITGGGDDDDDPCPAGQTRNPVTGLCEYTKVICGEGYTLNILTGQCEKDETKDDPEGGILTLPTPNLDLPGRGDFVTAEDVLVKNLGDVGGVYSILPAPVREPFLADRRQQDIRNVAGTLGIQQGQGLNQDPFAVDRFARYANAFSVGVPELLDISGVLPSDVPAYEEKFGVQFPDPGIAPPVMPQERIAEDRYDPTSFVPTAMADGGVVEQENGIESLLDRRQQAVNRMLAKRAGTYFGK